MDLIAKPSLSENRNEGCFGTHEEAGFPESNTMSISLVVMLMRFFLAIVLIRLTLLHDPLFY